MGAETAWGSSPLSRGIQAARGDCKECTRIIPALAGNTIPSGKSLMEFRDHPRSRGEYRTLVRDGAVTSGSSPLSRGIHAVARWNGMAAGIIPALAGNTRAHHLHRLPGEDHPRSRGEYAVYLEQNWYTQGSSPLSRGILPPQVSHILARRIIPALAGNTPRLMRPRAILRDHPRSRGEYLLLIAGGTALPGSSPLSRGIPTRYRPQRRNRRIIPALAGNTNPPCPVSSEATDHPRSRGEYSDAAESLESGSGSSPLSRGIPAP